MKLGDAFIAATESISSWFAHSLCQQDMGAYCDLETAEDDYTLVTSDGGLATAIRVDGNRSIIGRQAQETLDDKLYAALKGYLKGRNDHVLQVYYESDPDIVNRKIREALAPSYMTAKRIGLTMADVLTDQVNKLSQYCVHETAIWTIWTTPVAVPKETLKREWADKNDYKLKHKIGTFNDAQDPFRAVGSIKAKHSSVCKALLKDLKNFGLMGERYSCRESLRIVRMNIHPDSVSKEWQAALPGDRIVIRSPGDTGSGDLSHVYYPPLGQQLVNRRAEAIGTQFGIEAVRIGKRLHATLLFDMYPQDPQPFSALAGRIDREIPFRVSFLIEPEGLNKMGLNKSILAVFGSFGANKERKKALQDLENLEREGEPVVRMRLAITTWSESERILESHCSMITRAVQGWGAADVTPDAGDPIAAFVSTLPLYSKSNIAVPVFPPLEDVVHMLPTARPASPWIDGAILFRTIDGKVYPFQPGSKEQDTWVYLIFAPPGSGKSVLQNRMALAFCLSPGLSKLPYYTVIDVGPSSSGFVSLLHEALPKERRHEVGYFLLRMVRECAINPFDTQLGCRHPTQYERSFLVNFLIALATPGGHPAPDQGVADISGMLVDEVYAKCSDRGNGRPKLYESDRDKDVDEALARIGLEIEEHLRWWEVVDALFAAGDYHAASRAQRFAVPQLSDLTEICKSDKVRDQFAPSGASPLKISTGEELINAMPRIITSAIREYVVLSCETRFDLGQSRVISIDLNEVARGGGPEGEKKTALMYMLAMNVATRNYFISPDMVMEIHNACPAEYHAWHSARAAELYETPKVMACDEWHRAGKIKSQGLVGSVEQIAREGRKFKLLLSLASQLVNDFTPDLVDLTTGVFILKSETPETTANLKEKFGLTEAAVQYLGQHCHGPNEDGANFLAILQTKKGRYIQGLVNTLGSIEAWALSTTMEDRVLRSALYEKLPPAEARQLLAQRFPSGSAMKEIERRRLALGLSSSDDESNVIRELAVQLLKEHQSK